MRDVLCRVGRWTGTVPGMVAMVLALTIAPVAAQNDPLAPPPDLEAGGVPVPMDGTQILGNNNPPEEMIAVPVPPDTCAGLQAAVKSQGVVVFPLGNGNARRFVNDDTYCNTGDGTEPAWMPMPDDPRCFVGYTCIVGGSGDQ